MAGEELEAMEFNHACKWCGMTYPTKDGLATHKGPCEVEKHTLDGGHEVPEVEEVLDVRGARMKDYIWWNGRDGSPNSIPGGTGETWRTQWTRLTTSGRPQIGSEADRLG